MEKKKNFTTPSSPPNQLLRTSPACITLHPILKVSQIDKAGWPRGFFYPGVYNSNWCKIS